MTQVRINGASYNEARERAIERDGGKCVHCEWSPDDGGAKQLHVHHVVPRSSFSPPSDGDTLPNLVTLCSKCHGGWEKASRRMRNGEPVWWPEYREAVEEYSSEEVCGDDD